MTRGNPPSPAARRLIEETFDSVGALDLMLALRANPERWWTARELSDVLRCPRGWAERELGLLHERRMLASASSGDGERVYAYSPADAGIAGAVDELASAYTTHTRDVVRLIFTARR